MEESGHYYTVYYTSLAVGFSEYVAYRHAVLSQMSDEVTAMDASELQQAQCLGWRVVDLDNKKRYVNYRSRFSMQNGQHALVNKDSSEKIRSSEFQRNITRQMLEKEDAMSLKFGLLLHRLGDTFAHSKMGSERTMYTVNNSDSCGINVWLDNFGHLIHGHSPDYPFLRKPLFHSYLVTLYEVLFNKFLERSSLNYRRENYKPGVKTRPVSLVVNDFNVMFTKLDTRVAEYFKQATSFEAGGRRHSRAYSNVSDETKAEWFIKEIRNAAENILHVPMEPYAPEKDHGMSLKDFLDKHKDNKDPLKGLNINRDTINKTIKEMMPEQEPPVQLKNKAPSLQGRYGYP
jgi:hypothetical protein